MCLLTCILGCMVSYLLSALWYFNWLQFPIYDEPYKVTLVDSGDICGSRFEIWDEREEFIGYRDSLSRNIPWDSRLAIDLYLHLDDTMSICLPLFRRINGDPITVSREIWYFDGVRLLDK